MRLRREELVEMFELVSTENEHIKVRLFCTLNY